MIKRLTWLLSFMILVLGMTGTAFAVEEWKSFDEDGAGMVYISAAHEGKYLDGLAYAGISLADLAEIDLREYGLGEYLYDTDRDGEQEITVLHLVIFAHEILYGGDWNDVRISGGAGSIFFEEGLFGFVDGNLNYYVNGVYPLRKGSTNIGATADQIILSDGDFVDFSHYIDWGYYSDSNAGFHYFLESGAITHAYDATAGKPLTIALARTANGSNYSTVLKTEPSYTVYYGTSLYQKGAASVRTNAEGEATIIFPGAGTWYLWADGGYGADAVPKSIVSSPACAVVTVAEGSGEEAPEGLHCDADGIWRYYEHGVVAHSFTGLCYYSGLYFYVENGVLNWDYTGLAYYAGNYFYVESGMLNWGYTGLAYYAGNYFYVENGMLDWGYTGLVYYAGNYFYVENGMLNWGYTGLSCFSGIYFYVGNGILDWNYTGIVPYAGVRFYVENGVLTWNYNGTVIGPNGMICQIVGSVVQG